MAQVEEVSDWDSDDERLTYGPNTRRSRQAAYKKARLETEAKILRSNVASSAGKLGNESKQEDLRSERICMAASGLSAAASAVQADRDKYEVKTADSHVGLRESAACERNFLSTVPASASIEPTRDRPTRGAERTSASTSAAAVRALLYR